MTKIVLQKTGIIFLTVLKWGLQMLLWVLKLTLGMAKLFLVLFVLAVRLLLVMAGAAGKG